MPYIGKERETFLAKHKQKAIEEGDWNYLYSRAFAKVFSRIPAYKTIHLLKKSIHDTTLVSEVQEVDALLALINISTLDRQVARELAFEEFYDQIVRPYENKKMRDNGDIYTDLKIKLFGVEE